MALKLGERPADACEEVDVSTLDAVPSPAAGWEPPGPVSYDFVVSDKFIRGLAGPYGSGKSTTLTIDGLIRAARQPRQRDGVRRFRRVYVSDNYRDMYKTLIRTHNAEIPKEMGVWQGGIDRPARHDILLRDEYGLIEFTAEFVAIGDHRAEDVLDGYEPSDAVIDRASAVSRDVFRYLVGRVGRFPRHANFHEGDQVTKGVACAFNKPETDHWLYKIFVEEMDEERSKTRQLFDQPGGRSIDPPPENLKNLTPGYYDTMIAENEDWWVRRFVDNEWGFDRSGKPVYGDYRDAVHAAKTALTVLRGIDVGIGLDGGSTLNPAGVIGQLSGEAQWRILAECVPGHGYGASRFGELLRELLIQNFAGCSFYAFADPAAFLGGDREGGETAWAETVSNIIGVPIQPAPSNELSVRLDAVSQALRRDAPGGQKGLLLHPTACPLIRKGFNSGYQFRKTRVAGQETTEFLPAKTGEAGRFSHPHDALQYLVLGREGLHAVKARAGHGVGGSPGSADYGVTQGHWNPLDV